MTELQPEKMIKNKLQWHWAQKQRKQSKKVKCGSLLPAEHVKA